MISRRVLNYMREEYPKGFSFDSRHSESEFDYFYIGDEKKEFLLKNHRHIAHKRTLVPIIWFEEFTQELNTEYYISNNMLRLRDIEKDIESLKNGYIPIFRNLLKILTKK